MDNQNHTKVIKKHDDALETFCETKITTYQESIKTNSDNGDWRRLRKYLECLARDSEILGAIHLSGLVAKALKALSSYEFDEGAVRKKVGNVLDLLDLLKRDYKSYLDTTYVYKKITILSTLSTVQHHDCAQEIEDEFNIDEEFYNQWKCVVQ